MSKYRNATTFKPGVSGNPGGWSRQLEARFRELMAESRHQYKETKDASAFDVCFHRIMEIVLKGDDRDALAAIKLLAERTDGTPRQVIEAKVEGDVTPESMALLAAIRMTPQERRSALSRIDEEDARALAAAQDTSADDHPE